MLRNLQSAISEAHFCVLSGQKAISLPQSSNNKEVK